jgi:hypothetical protein
VCLASLLTSSSKPNAIDDPTQPASRPASHHRTNKVFPASLLPLPCMLNAIEEPALLPSITVLSQRSSHARLRHHPCQKPKEDTTLPRPATQHHFTDAAFFSNLLTPASFPNAREDLAPPSTTALGTKCSLFCPSLHSQISENETDEIVPPEVSLKSPLGPGESLEISGRAISNERSAQCSVLKF